MKRQQVLVIHGGTIFHSYDDYIAYLEAYPLERILEKSQKGWKDLLQENLGDQYEIIRPSMPRNYSMKYREWKIWIEKYFLLLEDNIILVGHSLGGTFWMKYLSENDFPVTIKALMCVAPAYEDTPDEPMDDFALGESLEKVAKQCDEIILYHSRDDGVVPYAHAGLFQQKLPSAEIVIFDDRGHFIGEKFPELVNNIHKRM